MLSCALHFLDVQCVKTLAVVSISQNGVLFCNSALTIGIAYAQHAVIRFTGSMSRKGKPPSYCCSAPDSNRLGLGHHDRARIVH